MGFTGLPSEWDGFASCLLAGLFAAAAAGAGDPRSFFAESVGALALGFSGSFGSALADDR